jgi:hypothetical protein
MAKSLDALENQAPKVIPSLTQPGHGARLSCSNEQHAYRKCCRCCYYRGRPITRRASTASIVCIEDDVFGTRTVSINHIL